MPGVASALEFDAARPAECPLEGCSPESRQCFVVSIPFGMICPSNEYYYVT